MRDVVAAAGHRSVRSRRLVVCALATLMAGFLPIAACKVSIPSGVFSCADGKRCPPGQVCGGDDICRDRNTSRRDASTDLDASGSDTGVDASVDGAMRDGGEGGAAGGGAGNGGAGQSGEPAAGSGGGGSGGAAGQGSVDGFHVASSQPAADGVLDDLGAGLKVNFSSEVDTATLTSDNVKLTRDGADVPGMLTVTSTGVTFKPDQPWSLATHYELKLTNVEGTGDHALEPFTLGFTTRDGRWMREKRADGTFGVISVAGDGFAVLAWSLPSTVPSENYLEMWATQFTPPSAWSTPVMIKSGANGNFLQKVIVNRRHRAAVSWTSISNNVNTTAYTTGPSWGPDAYISQTSYNDRMVLNESDELMVVVDSPVSGAPGIKGVRFTLGAVSPTQIEVGGAGGNNTQPGVALLDGNPRVVWQHAASNMAGAATQIMTGVLNSSAGTPLSADGVTAANAVLAGDAKQTSIIAAWEQADPSWTNVWVSRMVIGANWSAPVRISDNQSSVAAIRIALDPTGRGVAIWRQAGAIASSQFVPGTGWSAAAVISAVGAANIDPPQLVLDAAGNGIAAWTQDGSGAGLNEVWVARYLRNDGWQAAARVRVSDLEAGTSDVVSVGADDYGRAFVIWVQENAVWSSRFD